MNHNIEGLASEVLSVAHLNGFGGLFRLAELYEAKALAHALRVGLEAEGNNCAELGHMLVELRLRYIAIDVAHKNVGFRVKILLVCLSAERNRMVTKRLVVHLIKASEHFGLISERDVAITETLAVNALGVRRNGGGDNFKSGFVKEVLKIQIVKAFVGKAANMKRRAALNWGAAGVSRALIALKELLDLLVNEGCTALGVGAGTALGGGTGLGNLLSVSLLRAGLLLGRERGLLLGGLLLAHRQI